MPEHDLIVYSSRTKHDALQQRVRELEHQVWQASWTGPMPLAATR